MTVSACRVTSPAHPPLLPAVRFDDDIFLVDCGEGTRNQLQRAELDPAAIRTITVTHMHGDHCFGVGGVIQAVCEVRQRRQCITAILLHAWLAGCGQRAQLGALL